MTTSDYRIFGILNKPPTDLDIALLEMHFDEIADEDEHAIKNILQTAEIDRKKIKQLVSKFPIKVLGAFLMDGRNGVHTYLSERAKLKLYLNKTDLEITQDYVDKCSMKYYYEHVQGSLGEDYAE